jgi:hypothetical protein
MKTPREILLSRQRAVAPKLDAIRHSIVSALNNQATKQPSSDNFFVALFLRCSNKVWQELILPSRRIWAGLATVWLVILAIHFAQRDDSPSVRISAPPVLMSVGEQQRWLNQLLADRLPVTEMEPPKTFSPKPRTEITEFFTV